MKIVSDLVSIRTNESSFQDFMFENNHKFWGNQLHEFDIKVFCLKLKFFFRMTFKDINFHHFLKIETFYTKFLADSH
jgi:hypothetical protein